MYWQCNQDTRCHYSAVTMSAMASQITSLTIVYSTVYSGADKRKHQSSVPLAFVRGIHWSPMNSPHKWPVTLKMFPFDDVIMRVHSLQRTWNGVFLGLSFVLAILFNYIHLHNNHRSKNADLANYIKSFKKYVWSVLWRRSWWWMFVLW